MKYLYLILLITTFFSCRDKKKDEISLLVSEWQGKEITFPKKMIFSSQNNSIDNYEIPKTPYKVLIYIDSLGCTSCKLQLPRWKEMISYTDSITGNQLPYLFFFHPKDEKEVTFLLKRDGFNYPVCIDKGDTLNKLNGFPGDISFQTFLLDQNNNVVIIGNPIHNPAVKDLYIRQISGKTNARQQITTTAIADAAESNIGTIEVYSTKETKFGIKNTGQHPLVIVDVATTCGCAEPTFEKHPAKPGETVYVSVKMTPKDKGFFDETITVKCNADKMITLKIKGNAK